MLNRLSRGPPSDLLPVVVVDIRTPSVRRQMLPPPLGGTAVDYRLRTAGFEESERSGTYPVGRRTNWGGGACRWTSPEGLP